MNVWETYLMRDKTYTKGKGMAGNLYICCSLLAEYEEDSTWLWDVIYMCLAFMLNSLDVP